MFFVDLFKSPCRLEAENLFLRHQLSIALRRTRPHVRLRGKDWLSATIGAVVSSIPGAEGAPRSCPAGLMAEVGLRWCGVDAAFNRTEDLDVKVSKEALSSAIRSGWCRKGPATGHGRPQEQEGRIGLEAVARHCHAAIARGGDDCRHDAGDWLAAALGAWLPGRGGAQAPQAQAWIDEGGWDPGVPGCNRGERQSGRRQYPRTTVGHRNTGVYRMKSRLKLVK